MGSFLCGKDKDVWEDAIERLEKIPLRETMEKLELSYTGLEDDYKEIFLDIACILKGKSKEDAITILESCGFHARNGLKVLEQRSLITISKGGFLLMHDHIEEMGKNIVRREHPDEPNKHSRLWITEEIKDILANDMGTEATRCLKIFFARRNLGILMKGIGKMNKLRYLEVYFGWDFDYGREESDDACLGSYLILDESTQYFPNSVKYLKCSDYPFLYLPKTFQANNLVGLDMYHSRWEEKPSRMVQLWEEGEKKVLRKLKFLSLFTLKLTTFDFRITPNLERLSLHDSFKLKELCMPVSCQKLKHLDISGSKLRTFDNGLTPNLEMLSLIDSCDLVELFMPVCCQKLKHLIISQSKLRTFDLGLTPNLEWLSLDNCAYFVELHVSAACPNLKFLNLCGSWSLRSLDLELIPNLKSLNLRESSLTSLDLEPIPNLERAKRFKPWEKPIRNRLEDYEMRYSLKNGTTDIVPKSSQRKKLSHEGKTTLKEKLKEIEAFNSSSVSYMALVKRKNARTATRKEKRARCFICKERGHVLWKCHNKKNKNRGETWKPSFDKRLNYPKGLKDNFKMLDIEEDERKFIFSYGVGEASVETKDGALVIPNVYYTPEITMNVLNVEQLENQGYVVTYERNKCGIRYMFDEGEGMIDAQGDNSECSLIKGMEDLKMEKEDVHDYIDDEYLSMNGTLYAMKFVDDLGGYMNVSLDNKWNEIAKLLGLAQENQEAVKECYKEYIRMVKIYYEEAKRSKQEKPGKEVVGDGSGTAGIKEPQAVAEMDAEIGDSLDGTQGKTAQDNVKVEGNFDWTADNNGEEYTSSSDDFINVLYVKILLTFNSRREISEPKVNCNSATLHLVGDSLDLCRLHPNSNLPKLQFDCSYTEYLSSSVGNIEKLISFGLCACTDLKKFSDIICSLQCLQKLTLKCNYPEFPSDLGQLECLEELYLSSTKIKHLLDSICLLKRLKSLTVDYGDLLERLPKDLGKLECLEKLH
ncbi:disease resistance TIR-NBS-LRR class family protein, partial [Tanacetum coccineum]